jgi:hypothetical protein
VKIYNQTGDLKLIMGPLFGRQDYLYNIHYNIFDRPTLTAALTDAGFVYIEPYDWRKTEHAQIDDYSQAYFPHMDKEHGTPISLNLEARKSSQ